MSSLQAFGDCVYPIMFGGEPAGADKLEKLKEVTFNKISLMWF
jgi:hypothetical protein